jgi:hypothetical protein
MKSVNSLSRIRRKESRETVRVSSPTQQNASCLIHCHILNNGETLKSEAHLWLRASLVQDWQLERFC